MKGLFADTAGWVACADENDPDHKGAMGTRDQWFEAAGILVTTDYIIDETLTLLRVRLGITAAESWWRQVQESARVRYEWIESERAENARKIFFKLRDKAFSFTDCTSFVVMKELGLKYALTMDNHFTQMGFTALPGRKRGGR